MVTTANILPDRTLALFLDIDGTLLDLAPTPEAVVVPKDLPALLMAISRRLDGALALVSGRSLSSIDHLFPPGLACAGEHGAVLRYADGRLLENPDARILGLFRRDIQVTAASWPGVIVEEKTHSIAVHYRLAPERKEDVEALLEAIADDAPELEVIAAKMAFELRHRNYHKGRAVSIFMEAAPFQGRKPVFIGDDVTDENGIAAAEVLGGIGLRMDEAFEGQPALLREWLKRFAG